MDFTDCFTATVKFEKNYDLFNLKFSCIKGKQIFCGCRLMMAAAAVTACTANYRPDPFDLLNANIEALAQDETDQGESGSCGYCYSGGPGATSCSIEAGTEILGLGASMGCSVTCSGSYYACCSLRCICC